jgi:endo-alpha-1,4-polygalactosaminidase (GH114 family)
MSSPAKLCLTLLLTLLAAGAAPAAAGPAQPRLAAVESWAFAIGSGTLNGDLAARYGAYDLVVLDGQEARARQVRAVGASGGIALAYLSVGTIERWRPWYRKLKRYRLEAWKRWQGEFFARVRKRGFRRQIANRIAPALLEKGFDGLFLDNVDMIEGHRRQRHGMRRLVRRLGRLVHRRGGYLFTQNGFHVIGPSIRHLDGWNREEVTRSYDFDRDRYVRRRERQIAAAQDELRAVADRGLLVTATDYTARGRGPAVAEAIANACGAGALPYVSDIGLRRTPATPPAC